MSKYINPPTLSTSFSESGKSAKKRFDNILNTKVKKTGTIAFVVVIVIISIIGVIFTFNSNITYKNEKLGFSIELPKSWEGKYDVEEYEKGVQFYQKGTRDVYGEGTGGLFTIVRLDEILTKGQAEDTPNPSHFLMSSNGYTYIMGMPSDVQAPYWTDGDATLNKRLTNEYEKLVKDLDKIRKSIKAIDETNLANDTIRLFELKDTYVGDNSKVRNIVDLTNFTKLPIHSIELKTDSKPYRITINYKVDTRANYRFIDYRNFDKTKALMFALIPNTDEISCIVYDDYSDLNIPDTSFASVYCDKTLLYQRADDTGYFTVENIEKATSNPDIFTGYYKKVSALQPYSDSSYSSRMTAIYAVIGEDCEIVVNSGLSECVTITKELANKPEVNTILAQRNINISNYIDKQLEFQTYMIRNFKTNKNSDYLFVFNGDELVTTENLGVSGIDKKVMDAIRPYTDKDVK